MESYIQFFLHFFYMTQHYKTGQTFTFYSRTDNYLGHLQRDKDNAAKLSLFFPVFNDLHEE